MQFFNNFLGYLSLTISLFFIDNFTGNFLSNLPSTVHSEKTENTKSTTKNESIIITSFIATIQNNQVLISWKTNTEESNCQFLLEKSSNGSTFKEISKITGSVLGKTAKEYIVKDTKLPEKTTYYRLTRINESGVAERFDILALSNEKGIQSDCKVKINPDPCLGKCSITFCDSKSSINASVNFFMFDFLGNALQTNIMNRQESSGLEFDTQNYLKPGLFISKTTISTKNSENKSVISQ